MQTSRTNHKKEPKRNQIVIPLQLNSSTLQAEAYMHLPAVKQRRQRTDLEQAELCQTCKGQAGPCWAGPRAGGRGPGARLARPGSCGFRPPLLPLSSGEAKLILRLRPPQGGSAKAAPPAAAGNCLQCRGP